MTWLACARVPVVEATDDARLVAGGYVIATLPRSSADRITRGQSAVVRLAGSSPTDTIRATVRRITVRANAVDVELGFTSGDTHVDGERRAHIEIETARVSPLRLVLEAAGIAGR